MKTDSLSIIILAAGKGTRMHSDLPKVMHTLAGRPLLAHVIETAQQMHPLDITVVIGHGGDQVTAAFSEHDIKWVQQKQQLGTGHAVQQAIDTVKGDQVLVLYGDVPLILVETLNSLIAEKGDNKLAILSVDLANPRGYGRIVRARDGVVEKIVEQKDASAEELTITEGNTGILVANRDSLAGWLSSLDNNNKQGEYYLTDCVAACVAEGQPVNAKMTGNEAEVLGVNDKVQLHTLERFYQQSQAQQLLKQGVTLLDANRFDNRGNLECGKDVSIDINCLFEGNVTIGDNVEIGPNCSIKNAHIGKGTKILANCVIEASKVGRDCMIGPFARLRPGADLREGAKAGNFVEIKKSIIGKGSKVNHLTYIGDTEMGENVNIGAGTITCNYDGVNKHKTVMGDNVFIGSNSALIAPVTINDGATIGAGSTINKDATADKLTLERSKQITINAWQRPKKK